MTAALALAPLAAANLFDDTVAAIPKSRHADLEK
jgi:hypothetical protein